MPEWFFEEQPKGAPRRDPQEAELFKTEQSREGEYAGNDQLVREIIQNALDARHGDSVVRVRLAVHEAADAPATRMADYFARLREPLASRQIACEANGAPKLPCKFVVCEDFGTRGLEGDIGRDRDPPKDWQTKEDYWWFWMNIGRSAKTGDDLGRWGLGKTVFRAASRIRTMFGLTRRQSDGKRFLMGQAVLQTHTFQGREYIPEGYWCAGRSTIGLPVPVTGDPALDLFCREWKLTRKTEPGLSVVVPFVPEEVDAKLLLQAVAVHFFTRIVRGELAVEINGRGVQAQLDQSTIEAVCRRILWDGPRRTKRHVAPPIAFARQCLKQEPAVSSEELGRPNVPVLDEEAFSKESLAQLRQQFSAGLLTAARFRIWLPRKQGPPGQAGFLSLYLQRLGEGVQCEAYYVREGMTITKINAKAAKRGIQALVYVDAGPLAKLLGDSEGPAHEDWDTSEERPDREWKTWKGRVKFVRGIVDSMVELLTPPSTEPDFDLLADFFSIEQTAGAQRHRTPGDNQRESPTFEPPPFVPKWYQIADGQGGFSVCRTPQVVMPENTALVVSVAYDLPSGDPLKNWCSYDFEFGDGEGELKPSGRGLRARRLNGNQLMLLDLQEDFRVSVKGFDRHRDLYVRVDEVSPEEVNRD